MLDVYRSELKYIITIQEREQLKKKLDIWMISDKHNNEDGYVVRSLYFDTINDSDFEDKVDGYDNRKKIRIRVYDKGRGQIKLELKEKQSDFQRKRSLTLTKEEAKQMIKGDYSCLLKRKEPIALYLYTTMTTKGYRPKCVVEYNRYAFILKENNIRVTFDSNLKASESNFDIFNPNLMLYPVAKNTEVTMEVKYNEFLMTYVKNALSLNGRLRTSNSKYCRARKLSKKRY